VHLQVGMSAPQELCLRASGSSYVVFGLMGGVPLLLSLFIAQYREAMFWQASVLCFLVTAVFFVWLASFRLELSENIISYRTLFGGSCSLQLNEIAKVEIKAGSFDYSDRLKPTIRLIITPIPSVMKPPIVVNMKVFRREDMSELLERLNSKLRDYGVRVP
jgi:hypothetical protein